MNRDVFGGRMYLAMIIKKTATFSSSNTQRDTQRAQAAVLINVLTYTARGSRTATRMRAMTSPPSRDKDFCLQLFFLLYSPIFIAEYKNILIFYY